ncbi:uncharacterized protein LOC134219297 [Armigeres subalbatus]|uniref:uncharacterized protein LOC134219297 n=1 Tax=Armigeres subalbatus TaxID=124917 RepID=UPI002ED08535
MHAVLLIAVLLFCSSAYSSRRFSCENDRKYLSLGICIIEKLSYDDLDDLTEDSFPNTTSLEFRGIYFPYFTSHVFDLLPEGLQQLTLRNGHVREINLQSSSSIKRLRVIHTDLVTLDAVSEPNYSLKELAIRSPVFARWSPSLRFLRALEVIDLAYCNFTFVSLHWFESYEKLRVLDVSNNKLRTIASRPGLTLPALEELYIWSNRLEFVWRFPDAFPNLMILNLSSNLWRCSWVSLVRDAIHDQGIVVIDSDYSCGSGWVLNGGLCCQTNENSRNDSGGVDKMNDEKSSFSNAMLDYIVDNTKGKVIGMRYGSSIVYVDEPVT